MAIRAIANSYWRSIRRGNRTFESVKGSIKEDVRTLAGMDVESGEITAAEYQKFIGEEFPNSGGNL